MTDLREMEKYQIPGNPHNLIDLHKRIELRINGQAVTLNFDRFGLNGDIHEWLKKDIVLKIIEEEFGRLGNI